MKAGKEEVQKLKRIAGNIAKEIKAFWANIEKVRAHILLLIYDFMFCSLLWTNLRQIFLQDETYYCMNSYKATDD